MTHVVSMMPKTIRQFPMTQSRMSTWLLLLGILAPSDACLTTQLEQMNEISTVRLTRTLLGPL
eukprot:SAG11_NODE_25477_length_358_cov_0.965251_1_plen_62_part_10